ncbi:MAG: hypothetical protein GTN78_12915 [Gemmatimonadales bacterium]|nr:hypothetical protein [Gemmatimonadales bacterium]
MKTDELDRRMMELLEAARPEMREGWAGRACQAVAKVNPTRGWSLRMVAALVVGVVAVVGVGFVPFPAGSAKGALGRALAAVGDAATVHMRAHAWTSEGGFDLERWVSQDGFSRSERWENGGLVDLRISEGERVLFYRVSPEDGKAYAHEGFWPTNRYKQPAVLKGRSYLAGLFYSLESLATELGVTPPDVKISERREKSLWGGAVDVVEAEWTVEGSSHISGLDCRDGDRVRIRAEIDPETNHLIAMAQYRFEGTWEPTYLAEYEWDVDIPEAGEFRPPKGTELRRDTWWEERADQTLAAGTTEDWEVVLHSVDVNRRGDLVLSLHRAPRPESPISRWQNGAVAWEVEAVDDAGVGYRCTVGGPWSSYFLVSYGTATLVREQGEGNARTVTVTIYPYPRGETADQSVTFPNIPLPPRQDVDDVFAAETEVIQY